VVETIQLVLASESPRRRELIQWLHIPYKTYAPSIEESSNEKEPSAYVMDLARQKATHSFQSVSKKYSNPLVLSSDTIVVFENNVLEKPKDYDDAKKMLLTLSGRKHDVYTGVCLKSRTLEEVFFDKTTVIFEDIDEKTLSLYLDTGEAFDKAGSYGIQGAALSFIKRVEGSYSNVVGLPVNMIRLKLEEIFGDISWRNYFS
jgi:septum formation protein